MTSPRVDDPKKGDSVACTPQNTSQAKLIRMGMDVSSGSKGKKRPVNYP